MENRYNYPCIPQNDMDCYYNTTWKRMVEKMKIGTVNNFSFLENKINNELYQFVMEAKYGEDTILNNLAKFRDSYYNHRNNSFGPIIELVEEIQKIDSISDLSNVLSKMISINIDSLFTLTVSCHYQYPDVYCICLGDLPLTLGQREKYHSMEHIKLISYQTMLQNIYHFIKRNWQYHLSSVNNFVENICVFEILFSKLTLTMEESQNPFFVMNSCTYHTFLERFDVNDFWKNILDKFTLPDSYICYENIRLLDFLRKFMVGMGKDEWTMLKDYLVLCVARDYGIFSDTLFGAFSQELWKEIDQKQLFIQLLYSTFGPCLQSVFEAKHRNITKINYAFDIFHKMKDYCAEVINRSDMFNSITKIEANRKIATLDIIIGVTKDSNHLSNLSDLGSNFYRNLMIIHSFYFNAMIRMVGKKVDRYYLSITNDVYSFMVNAYYEPLSNLIYLPTSMLDDLFLDLNRDPIYNYGSIGVIIGHEMMHCFDTFGALFDHRGHLRNWWSKDDYRKYEKEVSKVMNHYSTLLLYGIPINSKASISEDIADIAGIKISFRTFLKTYCSKLKFNQLTFQQKEYLKKFFQSWAKTLRELEQPEDIESEIEHQIHSPNTIRINAPFSHLNEFYHIYDVGPEHLNYLNIGERTTFFD